ncbi:urease accessory protein D isoform X3 [Sesamum indicum]|uniref:Urease accessory protein D isoform X3 n=1 Tax=Sesamum indicum TaxID=4182 RepID=A0A8M8V6F3_SESIN|nr:urease accessory protein D isoform X3 [Sesamum indicum]
MERGKLVVERVEGRSTLTRCFSKYPFKFIVPNKAGSSKADAVWIYTITYGGGVVSGDSMACDVTVGDGATAVLTTQSSTKVYKSVGSKCSQQKMETSLEHGRHGGISERLQDYQVIAMIVLLGPKLKLIQSQIQEDVKKLMSQQLRLPSVSAGCSSESGSSYRLPKPSFLASCSTFGPKGAGVVIRVASMTTESVYNFLQDQLASLEALLGAAPYL